MYMDIQIYEVKDGCGKVFAISPEVKISVGVTEGYDYNRLASAQSNIQRFINDELNNCIDNREVR